MYKIKKILIILIITIIALIIHSGYSSAFTIVLDPGHGGKDPGAVNGSTYEKNVTIKIANYLKDILRFL